MTFSSLSKLWKHVLWSLAVTWEPHDGEPQLCRIECVTTAERLPEQVYLNSTWSETKNPFKAPAALILLIQIFPCTAGRRYRSPKAFLLFPDAACPEVTGQVLYNSRALLTEGNFNTSLWFASHRISWLDVGKVHFSLFIFVLLSVSPN